MKKKTEIGLGLIEVPYNNRPIDIVLAEDSESGFNKVYMIRAYIPKSPEYASGVMMELVTGVLDVPDFGEVDDRYNSFMENIIKKFGREITGIVGNELHFILDKNLLPHDAELREFMEKSNIRFGGLGNIGGLVHSMDKSGRPIVIHNFDEDDTDKFDIIREAANFSFDIFAKALMEEIMREYEKDENIPQGLRGIPASALVGDKEMKKAIELTKAVDKTKVMTRKERRSLDKKIFKDIKPTLFN